MNSNHGIRISSFAFRFIFGLLLCAFAIPLCYAWASSISSHAESLNAPETPLIMADLAGQWTIETKGDANKVRLSLSQQSDKNSFSHSTSDFPLEKLRGLTREKMMTSGATVGFKLIRDAGTFDFTGWFREGKGSGHFVFVPSQLFIGEMEKLGYDRLADDEVFALAVQDVSLGYVAELKALGFEKVSVEELIAMKIHGVSAKYITDLIARGYDKLNIESLIAMRIQGVSIAFIEDLNANGYRQVSVEDLVAMRIQGVSMDVVREMKALGYENPSVEDLVAMRIHGVTPEFIKDLGALGYSKVPPEDLVAMRIHGVTKAFIERMQARGFKGLSIEELVEMKIRGIEN